jgi:homospermidine synthase
MITLTIQIPDKDRELFEKLAERLNVKIIKVVEEDVQPNNVTKRAIADARLGKTQKIGNLDLFFKGL